MFTTSLTAAVIAGLLTSGSVLGLPEWTDSYGKAMAQSGEQKKPLAVFLAAGDMKTLTNGNSLGSNALKSLKMDYIAVRIDTTTADGKKVAEAFGISQGVVLSDRSGKQMALKHDGPLTPEQVAEYLTKYAGVSTISTTEHHSTVQLQQPLYQPAQYQQPVYQPYTYQQPRPVMNAIQNVGGAVQNFGGAMLSPFVGGS